MLYFILIVGFIAVFVFLFWRILSTHQPHHAVHDHYECPACNEQECECHKTDRSTRPYNDRQAHRK